MADLDAKVFNEQLKGVATGVRTAGFALITAAVVKAYQGDPNLGDTLWLVVGLWLAGGLLTAYIGTQLLTLMRPED